MSNVPVRKRNESKVQFIDTARELVVHTLHYTKKLPKAAMFLITKDIADLSREIYRCVVTANRFYPNTDGLSGGWERVFSRGGSTRGMQRSPTGPGGRTLRDATHGGSFGRRTENFNHL